MYIIYTLYNLYGIRFNLDEVILFIKLAKELGFNAYIIDYEHDIITTSGESATTYTQLIINKLCI